ncbi:MAG: hypothetical protein GXP27_09495, partial [Planctomycetes bacterium]|nr:hypothetical protein [Planctomycetota bacterium]
MHRPVVRAILLMAVMPLRVSAAGAAVQLVRQKADPYGIPRPGPNQTHVPTRTSFYIELTTDPKSKGDRVLADSVGVRLEGPDGQRLVLLRPGQRFEEGYHGKLFFRSDRRG